MKRIIVLAIFTILAGTITLFSQDKSHFSINYDMSFGTGDLGDFISKPSFRGASAQYRIAVKDNILLGVDAGWNVFYEKKEDDSYTSGTQTISGIQYRYQNEIPILIAADYLFTADKKIQPYVGIGIGAMYTERIVDMNLYRFELSPWHFAMKPEAGMMYEISDKTDLKLAGKYYYGFNTEDLDSQGYFTVSLGFAFQL
ncbi:MAG: outer membrane beta-barrel protein [Bacteroidales bacterium]|nr:outer membrane beta-barrel protein [Bacteroidales bacterium]